VELEHSQTCQGKGQQRYQCNRRGQHGHNLKSLAAWESSADPEQAKVQVANHFASIGSSRMKSITYGAPGYAPS
jgi:hypothetical protein